MDGLNILTYNEQIHNITLMGDVNEEMLKNLTTKIAEIRSADNEVAINNYSVLQSVGLDVTVGFPPINITLTTYGGEVYTALGIYDLIKDIQKHYTVNITANGYCMSAGTTILLAVDRKHRFAYENCTFLLHSLSGVSLGKIKQMEEDTKENRRLHEVMWKIYKDNTKIPENILNDIYEKKQDLFITSKQAKKWGLITEVI